MDTAENKALVRRMIADLLVAGREDLVDAYFAAEFVQFGQRVGPDQFRGVVHALGAAFTDRRITVEHLVAEDDLVVADLTVQGTQVGPFPFPGVGMLPPTGKAYTIRHTHWFRMRGGTIAEHWAVRDDLGHLTQLGHLPLPTPPAPAP